MNASEGIAYQWLLTERGYSPEEVRFRTRDTPDFILADGSSYEVKRLYGRSVVFTDGQWERIMDAGADILVVEEERVIDVIGNTELKDQPKRVRGYSVQYTTTSRSGEAQYTSMRVRREVLGHGRRLETELRRKGFERLPGELHAILEEGGVSAVTDAAYRLLAAELGVDLDEHPPGRNGTRGT